MPHLDHVLALALAKRHADRCNLAPAVTVDQVRPTPARASERTIEAAER